MRDGEIVYQSVRPVGAGAGRSVGGRQPRVHSTVPEREQKRAAVCCGAQDHGTTSLPLHHVKAGR